MYIIPDFGMKLIEDYLPKHWNQDQKAKYLEQMQEIIYLNGQAMIWKLLIQILYMVILESNFIETHQL